MVIRVFVGSSASVVRPDVEAWAVGPAGGEKMINDFIHTQYRTMYVAQEFVFLDPNDVERSKT
jgi:hypothetical protein